MSKINSVKLISLFMITALCACGPTINYTRKNNLNIKKTENCEIYVYNTNQSIPFPNINLGEIKFGDTGLSTDCGFETIINIAKKKACTEGADAIQIVEMKVPDAWSTCYRIRARFVKFSYDNNIVGPEVLIGEPQKEQLIEKYFKNRNMDLIEGIWVSQDTRYEIAIIKNNFNRFSQYDYVAIIMNSGIADWKNGETKFLLKKTASDYVYIMLYFMQNKAQYGTTITLPNENVIEIPISSNENSIFIRTYPRKASPSTPSPKVVENSLSGTGFFISKDGLIVTAHHVVKNASSIKIHLNNGSVVKANIYKSDPSNDIAILKTDLQATNYLPIAPLRTAKTGERVFTIGFPISSVLGQEAKYTEGVISALSGIAGAESFLQITVPVQPGNSGGPLVNENGCVVGIISSSAAILPFLANTGTIPQNINWAVKADYLRPLVDLPSDKAIKLNRDELIEKARRSVVLIEATNQ